MKSHESAPEMEPLARLKRVLSKECATTLDGDKLQWSQSTEGKLRDEVKRILSNLDHKYVAIAFWMLNNAHTTFDIQENKFAHLFLASSKLHGDDPVPVEDTLLISCLQEHSPDWDIVLALVTTSHEQVALNPRKKNGKGQTAFTVFLESLVTNKYLEPYINAAGTRELEALPEDLLQVFERLLTVGYFSSLGALEREDLISWLKRASMRRSKSFMEDTDAKHIKMHVEGLRVMNRECSVNNAKRLDKEREEASIAKDFRRAMTSHANERERRCRVAIDLLFHIVKTLERKHHDLCAKKEKAAVTQKSSGLVNLTQSLQDLWRLPELPLLVLILWEGFHLGMEESLGCGVTTENDVTPASAFFIIALTVSLACIAVFFICQSPHAVWKLIGQFLGWVIAMGFSARNVNNAVSELGSADPRCQVQGVLNCLSVLLNGAVGMLCFSSIVDNKHPKRL